MAGLFGGVFALLPVPGGLVGSCFALGDAAGLDGVLDFGDEQYHGSDCLREDGDEECRSGGYGENSRQRVDGVLPVVGKDVSVIVYQIVKNPCVTIAAVRSAVAGKAFIIARWAIFIWSTF